jgi:hypothetical protein
MGPDKIAVADGKGGGTTVWYAKLEWPEHVAGEDNPAIYDCPEE